MEEYKFRINEDFKAENVAIELKTQGLAQEVLFNQSENTITLKIAKGEFDRVSNFISEYGFIVRDIEEVLKKMKELDVRYIVFNGYYSNKDDGDELVEHTEETLYLYYQGLNNTYEGDLEDNENTFNGICFDTDNSPLAEWWIDSTEEYFNIQ